MRLGVGHGMCIRELKLYWVTMTCYPPMEKMPSSIFIMRAKGAGFK